MTKSGINGYEFGYYNGQSVISLLYLHVFVIVLLMVYFIQSETSFIKIGYTDRPIEERIKALQTGCPDKLVLLATIPGDKHTEDYVHEKFAFSRIRGEWFKPTPELFQFIRDNSSSDIIGSKKEESDNFELSIGNNIKTLRLFKNIDRATFCDKAKISMNALRHLENGGGTTIRTLVRAVCALGRQDWLLSLSPTITINPLHMAKPRQRASKRSKDK